MRMYDPSSWGGGTVIPRRTSVEGLTIDGTSAGANSAGLHVGDLGMLKLDVSVQNFTGAGSSGINFDNVVNWTEEADVRAYVKNCTTHVVFRVTTGHKSFGYGAYDFTIVAGSNQQDGVSLLNGATLYHGSLRIRGNFTAGASATTAAVLRLQGAAPGGSPDAGATCLIATTHLDVKVECGAGANAPQTVWLDAVNFAGISGCQGALAFDAGGATFAAATVVEGQVHFSGLINDPSGGLAPVFAGDASKVWRAIGNPAVYRAGPAPRLSAGTLYVRAPSADVFQATLTGNVTISLNDPFANSGNSLGLPQRVVIILTQAGAGGPYTVTWPHPGSPTIASPTVLWPGGVAPTMSAGAGAVDRYVLDTPDGIRWYGTASQALA
jgi:hypothetical protein